MDAALHRSGGGARVEVVILRSSCFRTTARIFAVLLLAWTSADLCGGLCVHDREPIASAVPAGPHGARTIDTPSGAVEHLPNGPDDCFCCSRFVHPQVRYVFVPAYTLVAAVEDTAASRPRFTPSRLYRPPIE